jgi:proline dehydrogenase
VAGETSASALEHAERVNARGVTAILNRLGEHYGARGPADEDARAYLDLVDDIVERDVDAVISMKPSQMGLRVHEGVFRENVSRVVEHAAERGVFVWLDMEDHQTTDATLDAFVDLAREHDGGVGVCVQANLKRTADDLERLVDVPGKIRLVKGAYDEPAAIAHTRKSVVNEQFREYLEFMFEEFEAGVAVGSHDPAMVSLARDLHEEYGTPYEVQMLMGVREAAQFDLAREGVAVYQYVPFGSRWLSYFTRRVMERKENIVFALRAVVGR